MYFTPKLASVFLLLALSPAALAQSEIFIHNFHRVDDHVLRGAQPGTDGLRALAATGVKTIVDLRPGEEREAKEKQEAEALGMKYINIPMNGFHAPSTAEVTQTLAVLNDSSAWPVFVHCKYGEDRTGTVVACYRIRHDGWDNQKALSEAKKMGMHIWETGMKKFIAAFPPS